MPYSALRPLGQVGVVLGGRGEWGGKAKWRQGGGFQVGRAGKGQFRPRRGVGMTEQAFAES